jgi:hypothetical protein
MGVPDNYKPALHPINYRTDVAVLQLERRLRAAAERDHATHRTRYNLHPWRNQFLPAWDCSRGRVIVQELPPAGILNARFAADFFK